MQTVNKKDGAAEVRSVVINWKEGQTQHFENPSSVRGCCPSALFPDSLKAAVGALCEGMGQCLGSQILAYGRSAVLSREEEHTGCAGET